MLLLKLNEMSDETVCFDASTEDKIALLAFIEASIEDLECDVVEIGTLSNVRKEEFEEMHRIISEQSGHDLSVKMPRDMFGKMGIVAGIWKRHGFEQVFPEDHDVLRADKDTVYAVHNMFCEGFNLET